MSDVAYKDIQKAGQTIDSTSLWHHGESRTEPLSLLSLLKESSQSNQSGELKAHQDLAPGRTTDETVRVGGQDREFAVHVPQSWDGKTALPVLYYFNGMHPDGKHEPETFTGLSDRADRQNFAVVYMRGSNPGTQTYNNGQRVFANDADESAYLNAVHNVIAGQLPLDESRQGLAGFSQGGSEAYSLAATNHWVSSVQSVEGYMTGSETPLTRPISEQNIHALRDPIIPHNGTNQVCEQANREMLEGFQIMSLSGEDYINPRATLHALECVIERNGNNIESQSRIVENYRAAIGAAGEPRVTVGNNDTTRVYTNTATGAEVRQVVLNTGTHGWAGSNDHSGDIPVIGVPNERYSASDSIAEFFMSHPLVPPSRK
jgi:poly(3-hydroxybutyrate) depolymerase